MKQEDKRAASARFFYQETEDEPIFSPSPLPVDVLEDENEARANQ